MYIRPRRDGRITRLQGQFTGRMRADAGAPFCAAYASAMEIALPGSDHPTRRQIVQWLRDHPHPAGRQLAQAGYVAPHLPQPWGLDADPISQLIIDEELRRAGVHRPFNLIGIGWAAPTLIHAGNREQQDRWLPGILSGEELWCQLFSEPGAGSDLAALTTKAVRDGDEWIVNGQKVWTTFAHMAKYGILLARTDPEGTKHEGISYFVCPMQQPGIEVRPLVDMTGEHAFNEVFFNDARIPADHLVGHQGRGWELARVTLGNERVSLSGAGALWGQGPTADDLVREVQSVDSACDPILRQRLVEVWAEGRVLELLRMRTLSAVLAGREPGPEASVRKAISDAHGQHVMDLGRDLAGAFGMVADTSPNAGRKRSPNGSKPTGNPTDSTQWPGHTWSRGFLFSCALTIGGGTSEVQRNIIAERVLGLPRDPS